MRSLRPDAYYKVLAAVLLAGTLAPVMATLTAPVVGAVTQHPPVPSMETAPVLSATEIQTRLLRLPAWRLEGQEIVCDRKFVGFPEAIAFLDRLVDPAEAAGHHPDLQVSYNRVTVRLTTHDAGGLTDKDFDLAEIINQL